MSDIIQLDKSIIVACDVDLHERGPNGEASFEDIVKATADVPGIGGYKLGAVSGEEGWKQWVRVARDYTGKTLIHDGQKWGNDIPDTGTVIIGALKRSGVDAVILFPFSSPIVQYEWTKSAQDSGIGVIVGSKMTHNRQLDGDFSNPAGKDYTAIFKELVGYDISGYIREDAPEDMYLLAAKMGVVNFVAPGNKPDDVRQLREFLESQGISPIFYAPGFVAQGGVISDAAKVAGPRFHAIVGRGIYGAKDIRVAAQEMTSQLFG
ncbi:MAG: hypothetical protein HYT70_00065 [Candidatus Aenigmarchaeota archaeon]|nr:hypothetical protein [Candidatus Aenigmarchaeota archaeon]